MNLVTRWISVVVLAAGLSGCASFNMTKPAPVQEKAMAISFENEELSGWSDLPPGVYRIPDSQTLISGHQKGGIAGILFGPLGVLVQSAMNSSQGASATQDVHKTLQITLKSEAHEIVRGLASSIDFNEKYTLNAEPTSPKLDVASALVLTFVDDNNVRPFVVLQASIRQPGATEPLWTTRYMSSMGAPRPLVGPQSWTDNGGEELKKSVSANLEKAIRFMLSDVAAPYARDDAKLSLVKGSFPFVRKRLQLIGYHLTEDEQTVVFVPKLGDILVFAGVNIMDKAAVVERPKREGDLPFTLAEEDEN